MRLSVKFISLMVISTVIHSSAVLANCVGGDRSFTIKLKVKSCEKIVAEKNSEVKKQMVNNTNISRDVHKRFYTGALVRDDKDLLWMYPSTASNPCQQFRKNAVVSKTAGRACCDTGAWGKCVFGGAFIWDLNSKPINTFQ